MQRTRSSANRNPQRPNKVISLGTGDFLRAFLNRMVTHRLKMIVSQVKEINTQLIWLNLLVMGMAMLPWAICQGQSPASKTSSSLSAELSEFWQIEKCYQAPPYRVIAKNDTAWSIVFEGPDFDGEKREVFAYYSNPSILKTGHNTDAAYPGVLLLHGGTGRAFAAWVQKWASDGYAALAIDMSARDGLASFTLPPGPKDNDENKFSAISQGPRHLWQYFAVQSAVLSHSLLRSFPEVDSTKTAITGISWGGYLTCLVTGLDHRFKASVPVYGCGFYEGIEGAKKYFSTMSQQDVQTWLRYLDPKHYLPAVRCPMLFINSNKDFFFDLKSFQKSYALVDERFRAIRITPDMAHGHSAGWAPFEIKYFMDQQLKAGFPLPEIKQVAQQDTLLTAEFESPVLPWYARFHYTSDTTSKNIDRHWSVTGAEVHQGLIRVKLPEEGFAMGFLELRDERNLSVSSPLIYQKQ